MARSRLAVETGLPPWPLPPGWLLHDDGDVVVACKPAGVSVTAPERGAANDLTARVRALRGNPGADGYLCPHTHVDRDTSGLVVFAGRRDVNAALARPGAIAVSHLVACLAPHGLDEQGRLSALIVKDRDGVLRPAASGRRNARTASIEYRRLAQHGDRVLLEVPDQQGSRRLRAVLAACGLPVVGDPVLGGPRASRLLVHAGSLRLTHPRTGTPLELSVPAPWYFEAWMRGALGVLDLEATLLHDALSECASLRFGCLEPQHGDACRLVHGEAENLTGVDVERFGRYAVVWVHEQASRPSVEAITQAVHALGWDGTYLKVRPKQASRIVHAQDAELASAHAARGADAPEQLVVHENGVRFLVRLGDGLSTGLFLDQRPNRCWVRAHAAGKTVLNLFAYTCSFTVAAAVAGARRTVSVDASKRYLELGEENLLLNGLDPASHEFVCDDVGSWAQRALHDGSRFDIVLLDPPSFGTSRRRRFSVMSDYVDLAASCFALLAEGGVLLACTNHRGVTRRKLRGWLREASRRAGWAGVGLRDAPTAADFPVPAGAEPHMKAVICAPEARGEPGTDPGVGSKGRSSVAPRTRNRRGRSSKKRGGHLGGVW